MIQVQNNTNANLFVPLFVFFFFCFPGIAVRVNIDDASLMHHKFVLIDVNPNEKFDTKNKHPFEGLLVTGSLNWTNNVSIHWSQFTEYALHNL